MATILLVNHNADNRELLRYILSAKHNILEADDGEEGLRLFDLNKPDMVITDISLPIMSGLELISQIRRSNRSVKIIAFTENYTIPVNSFATLRTEADQCLSLPFGVNILEQTVANLFARNSGVTYVSYLESSI